MHLKLKLHKRKREIKLIDVINMRQVIGLTCVGVFTVRGHT